MCGPVLRASLLRGAANQPMGTAYVEMVSPAARAQALALNGSLLLGQPIFVR